MSQGFETWRTRTLNGRMPYHRDSSVLGRLTLRAMIWVVLFIVLAWNDVQPAPLLALLGLAAIEAAMFMWKLRRLRNTQAKAHALKQDLHQLEQEDLRRRVAEAEARGDFDRFGRAPKQE